MPPSRRHTWTGIGGIVIGLVALCAMGSTAVHAMRSETQLVSSTHIRQADASNAFYNCLEAQAHSLVHPRDVVFLADPDLARWVTVTKAVGGWADLTVHQSKATVALVLQHKAHGPSCTGFVLFSIRDPHGRVIMTPATSRTP